ncbi:hypothetical protein, partial [Streptomyces albidoflavus]|uniref:hypothetical protein n=1 Tax=Streptomyces albidoflavus TaxID=1886 RepID=UPI001A91F9BF
SDHTSHAKIISSVTSSYGTALSRAKRISEEYDGDFVARSRELRRWADAVAQSIVVICTCGRKFLPENIFSINGGRPKRYCSNACKQSAYRSRKKLARSRES